MLQPNQASKKYGKDKALMKLIMKPLMLNIKKKNHHQFTNHEI